MPVESAKKDVLTKLLEHLPSRKKIILTIPQTHPHNLPTMHTSPNFSQTIIQSCTLTKKHPLSDLSARIIFITLSVNIKSNNLKI
jgi:hypothetical protein